MKILIQNCFTHRYLKTPGEWVINPDDAKVFSDSQCAMQFCARHRIPEVQIVLKFEYDRYDIALPITEECQEAQPPAA